MADRKLAIYGVAADPSSVLSLVERFLSSREYGGYLVITRDGDIRDGDICDICDIYNVQNSYFVEGVEEAEEATKTGRIPQEAVEEVERLSEELGLNQPVVESIKIVKI